MTDSVSVVVPTYKRPHLLDRCLRAVIAQDHSLGRLEIVVVDDGNDPETWRTVERRRLQLQGRIAVRYLAQHERRGPAAARNRGWRACIGNIVAFTDDDCIPARDWLQEGVRALGTERAAVWGRIVVPLPPDPTDYERDAARLTAAGFVTANCFCRRETLAAVNGLDEQFTAAWREDSDLYFSLLKRGFDVAHAPRAVVVHPVRRASWGASVRQQRKILFDALLYKKHPTLYRAYVRPAPRWDYYAISLLLLGAIAGWLFDAAMLSVAAAIGWVFATAAFCRRRLRDTSRRPAHVIEMAATSAVIPPLAVFWRMVGAMKFRVMFF